MPPLMVRIFLLYNLFNSRLLCLIPIKLRRLFHDANNPNKIPPPSPSRIDPAELKRVFQMFDKNGDGRITKEELSDYLESLGLFIPDKDLTQMICKIDENGDGCVDMDEFESLYMSIMDENDEEDDGMKDAFNVFDQDGDGFITVEELKSVMGGSLELKQGKTLEDCKKMIIQVDVDGDGRVNYKEFLHMMKGSGFGKFKA
ncbi:PREDICTED: calmodulin-like protein 7 [Tarenaya hassleriana]|uniref:calmodulin-like protein 7 n=1 Tax=Tarenaya hassleriana TaxID=28532 RepID=UPI00053C1F53|nr:PREDICTED: calmodulin-like protein 7 [Tarenaya hassleriana]